MDLRHPQDFFQCTSGMHRFEWERIRQIFPIKVRTLHASWFVVSFQSHAAFFRMIKALSLCWVQWEHYAQQRFMKKSEERDSPSMKKGGFQLSLDGGIRNVIKRREPMNQANKYGPCIQLALVYRGPCWRWHSACFILQWLPKIVHTLLEKGPKAHWFR